MNKMTKEEVKDILQKKIDEVTKEQLLEVFGIFSLQLKEYSRYKHNLSFEIHFERTFLIRVNYPIENGMMDFNNEFVNFGDGCHGVAMPRSKSVGELLKVFINMFYDNLLQDCRYRAYYDNDESIYSSQEEAQEYLKFVQSII